jgi:hypothetical protein
MQLALISNSSFLIGTLYELFFFDLNHHNMTTSSIIDNIELHDYLV